MSYGLDNYLSNMVSDPVLLFLTVLQLDIKKRRMWFPKVLISAVDKISKDVKNQSTDYYFFSPGYDLHM